MGAQLNDVLTWMLSRLKGEQEYQDLLRTLLEISKDHIQILVEKKQKDAAEKARKLAE